MLSMINIAGSREIIVIGMTRVTSAEEGTRLLAIDAAGIRFDQTAPPEARLVLSDAWGGSIHMSTEEFRQLARGGVSNRFETPARASSSARRTGSARSSRRSAKRH
jgi:hypothetical protein